ncbi:MAG: tetratricopeptide repeat protein [Syntrophaceae bacterium]|nr:tetratricopeptide repeat protein [Syntrophaceae bacterium]
MDKLDNADQLLREGKYTEAIALLEEVHQANPEEESVLLRLAWAHHDRGTTAKAIEYLEILLDRELQRRIFTGFAFDELVRIYKQEKNFSKLLEICTNAVVRQPEDVCLLSELGNAYLLADRVQEACSTFEKLVQLENDNPAFYCLWGEALFIEGNTAASEAAYIRAGEIDSDQADRYYYRIADLFAKSGYYEDAKRLLDACIASNPANPLYHCCLGDALVGLGRIGEAQSEYADAARCDSSGAGAYYNRFGNILARTNHHQEAIKAFEHALKIEPNNPVYLRHLAISYKALGLIKDVNEKR